MKATVYRYNAKDRKDRHFNNCSSEKNPNIDVRKAQEQFSIACKKYIESKPHQDMIKALKRTGAF